MLDPGAAAIVCVKRFMHVFAFRSLPLLSIHINGTRHLTEGDDQVHSVLPLIEKVHSAQDSSQVPLAAA